ncbi:hypothetical protein HME9304_03327 [Flagellimonas maritima]|uniref:Outer membrane protein beta-barrel domain-containing protein n=1 Tax=Flagellimonas maritima TaxID=1383885 RepID=A0A2Z4LWD5_9FLAO|nr:outer membrane beta-barrel protein [Allomuricauda aurantiaca]AWX46295.1 hypothetical protein HME9304_03327 [Allomuricauda aurantiaca]
MKKNVLFSFAMLLGFALVHAQGDFKAGIGAGLPIGDAGDLATFAIAVDLGYLFEVSDDFQVGPTVGYSHSFGEETDIVVDGEEIGNVEVDDVQFIPIGGAARFNLSETFSLGADLGYAIGVNDGNDGGFYYSPRAAYSVSEALDIVFAYRGVSLDGGSWDILSLGLEFDIN